MITNSSSFSNGKRKKEMKFIILLFKNEKMIGVLKMEVIWQE